MQLNIMTLVPDSLRCGRLYFFGLSSRVRVPIKFVNAKTYKALENFTEFTTFVHLGTQIKLSTLCPKNVHLFIFQITLSKINRF